jgi:hypothetical protein
MPWGIMRALMRCFHGAFQGAEGGGLPGVREVYSELSSMSRCFAGHQRWREGTAEEGCIINTRLKLRIS